MPLFDQELNVVEIRWCVAPFLSERSNLNISVMQSLSCLKDAGEIVHSVHR